MSDLFKNMPLTIVSENDNIDYTAFDDSIKIKQMNDKHAFINSLGGRPFILCHVYDESFDKEVIEFRSAESITLQYSNISVYVPTSAGQKAVPLGRYWIQHAQRREYETVVFDPCKPKEFAPIISQPTKQVLNLWEGLSIIPKKGSWKHTRKHIYSIICNKDKAKFKYFIKWLAWAMQNPDKQAEVAMVIKGKQGAGKGVIFSQFKHVFGKHYMNISSGDHLTGKFNAHLRNTVFLFADEAYDPKDREAEGKLKQLITEPTIPIEAKFKDTVIAKNRLHIVMATNNPRVLVASEDTRRFFINQCDNTWAKGQGKTEYQRALYFKKIFNEMDLGGREAMIFDLLNIKLKDWHPRFSIPETKEMNFQKRLNYSEENALIEYLEQGDFPGKKHPKGYIAKASDLEKHMRNIIPMMKDNMKISWKRMSLILEELGINKNNRRKFRNKDGVYYIFPELNTLRRIWDIKHPSSKGEWNTRETPRSKSEFDMQDWKNNREWSLIKDVF